MSEGEPARARRRFAPLHEEIVLRIRSGGPITFAEFMDLALYDPGGGYYERTETPIGRSGDFTTAPEATPAFAQTLAVQVAACLAEVGDGPLDLVEVGAGRGTLLDDLLGELRTNRPDLLARIRATVVERSEARRAEQRRTLREWGERVAFVRSIGDVRPGGIVGVVFANELYDALAVRVVRRENGALIERSVGLDGGDAEVGSFVWVDRPANDLALTAYAERYGAAREEGAIAEIGLAAASLAGEICGAIARGFHLVIDYGDRAARLYDARTRPAGTLMGYQGHIAREDVLVHPGDRDLTAHVNFSGLEDAATSAGAVTAGFTTQSRFLIALGMAERIAALAGRSDPASTQRRAAMMSLIHPEGMGETFRVLMLAKGVASDGLRGFADPFRLD